MVTDSSWEQVTLALIEQNQRKIEEARKDAELRIAAYEREHDALKEALRIYRETIGNGQLRGAFALSKEDVHEKSQMEILRLIASRNDGLLAVKEVIRAMKEAQVFGNPHNADAAVYSLLNRRKEFVKVSPGLYRLQSALATSTQRSSGHRGRTGLREVVRRLKEEDPSLTATEIKNRLIAEGFDFQGKNPGSAVNMAIASLSIGKKNIEPQNNPPPLFNSVA